MRSGQYSFVAGRKFAHAFVALATVCGGLYLMQEDQIGGTALASAMSNSGFKVNNLVINGAESLDTDHVKASLAPLLQKSIFNVDADNARERISGIQWVKSSTVRKVYPDTLVVDVVERVPVALWKSDGDLYLISRDGFAIAKAEAHHMHLPQVVGDGANDVASEFLAVIDRYPQLVRRANAYVRVGSRRWNLVLDNGVTILLPSDEWRGSLNQLVDLQESRRILERDLEQIDMRLSDRLVFRLAPGAAKGRKENLKKIMSSKRRQT
jgi:cell division protein FtsQ